MDTWFSLPGQTEGIYAWVNLAGNSDSLLTLNVNDTLLVHTNDKSVSLRASNASQNVAIHVAGQAAIDSRLTVGLSSNTLFVDQILGM